MVQMRAESIISRMKAVVKGVPDSGGRTHLRPARTCMVQMRAESIMSRMNVVKGTSLLATGPSPTLTISGLSGGRGVQP
jgi:hypothetical protein